VSTLALTLPDYFLVSPSARLSYLFTVKNSPCKSRDMFSSGKRFGLVYEDKREIGAHNTAGKERASFNVINPAFLDLSIDIGYETSLQKSQLMLSPSFHSAFLC
jgi:hypothetical protein